MLSNCIWIVSCWQWSTPTGRHKAHVISGMRGDRQLTAPCLCLSDSQLTVDFSESFLLLFYSHSVRVSNILPYVFSHFVWLLTEVLQEQSLPVAAPPPSPSLFDWMFAPFTTSVNQQIFLLYFQRERRETNSLTPYSWNMRGNLCYILAYNCKQLYH